MHNSNNNNHTPNVKRRLGIDLGSNSIGWAVLDIDSSPAENEACRIVDAGVHIFNKAVNEKTPTPKNIDRRNARLGRRVLQRRARRKQRMLRYLIRLHLLPAELAHAPQPEVILNSIGDPYDLRAKALDQALTKFELGRVFLHLVQRRGFLSNRKCLLGDMIDDPDIPEELHADLSVSNDPDEKGFKAEIDNLRRRIAEGDFRTLGEFLASQRRLNCRRNRAHLDAGDLIRTDRKMYEDEFTAICEKQIAHHPDLTPGVKDELHKIIFHQRPIRLRKDRVGKCSLEPTKTRASMARLEVQRFRYLQDINHLKLSVDGVSVEIEVEARNNLIGLFEDNPAPTFLKLKKALGLPKTAECKNDTGVKKLKGNTTACKIRKLLPIWDALIDEEQHSLVEDLLSMRKKSALKKRLINHWKFTADEAVRLCLLEFEPGHSNHSLKAINKLLPHLEAGEIYSEARKKAGYTYEQSPKSKADKLAAPPETNNPIVNKALHSLRHLIHAVIAEYGRPDAIVVEMARDLEMNTKRNKDYIKQQLANTKVNDEAEREYQLVREAYPHLKLRSYPSLDDKLRYRLWKDQGQRCAYSNEAINLATLFSAEIEVDHILPKSLSLDDSYMNKVVSFTKMNRKKGQKTPLDAFGDDMALWNQIIAAVNAWPKSLQSKKGRFWKSNESLEDRDFTRTQLNDTRYISKVALTYLSQLGIEVEATKGRLTFDLRHHWGLNSILGNSSEKERIDHRHHAIDAAVIACIDKNLHGRLIHHARAEAEYGNSGGIAISAPCAGFRNQLLEVIDRTLVSHTPRKKIEGALHEDSGISFTEGVGAIYRKRLDIKFTSKRAQNIIDPVVRDIVVNHLTNHGNNPKQAFAKKITVRHRNGLTPIYRVRIRQRETDREKLDKYKLPVRNKKGKTFKWLTYGNTHHLEIIENIKTGKISGSFITAMEAAKRAKGIGREKKQPIIQTDHGINETFHFALHINDPVSILINDKRIHYRIELFMATENKFVIRTNCCANKNNKENTKTLTVNNDLFSKYGLRKHRVNVLGKDQS